ncbi:MAG: helix-turn-helix domain-containing protein [Roseburia hominis]|nr:helix-turn-helix domain-containing protein [Roseburia hominis]
MRKYVVSDRARRGKPAAWAKAHGVNYHKTLILYSMRHNEECTQKQIRENYRLPKQTVNNIVTELRREGMITLVPAKDGGREKVLYIR